MKNSDLNEISQWRRTLWLLQMERKDLPREVRQVIVATARAMTELLRRSEHIFLDDAVTLDVDSDGVKNEWPEGNKLKWRALR